MNTRPYKEVRLAKYLQLLDSKLARHARLALCDPSGETVWASDAEDGAGISQAIDALRAAGFAWETDASGARRRNVDGEHTLYYRELRSDGDMFGWLALLLKREAAEQADSKRDGLAATLQTMVEFIEDEYRMHVENESLAADIARRHEELNLVYSLGDITDISFGADGSLMALLNGIARHMDVDIVAFMQRGLDRPVYATNTREPIANLDLILVELGGNLFRFVAADRRTVVLNDRQDPRREFLLPHLPFKFLACPVTRKEFNGMLVLARHDRRPDFENGDRSLAHAIAEQLGTMLRNQTMLESMRLFGEQLAGALIEAVEAKDPYTRGHSERVQSIAVHLGHALGLEKVDLQDLYWGSIMHDVGKIGIPDVILSKPGRLTAAEFTFVKTHPERSYEILQHVEYATPNTLAGARYHHERYDGGGYPSGLRGKEIPLHARIIAVADTYDAMTSSRSYRAALAHEAAMAEIARVSGTQLDPEVADALRKAADDGSRWLDRITFQRCTDRG